jgi:hypothetical protein
VKCVAMLPIVVVLWFCIHHAALNLLVVANFDVALGHDGFRSGTYKLCIALHTRLLLVVLACVLMLYLL